MKALLAIIVVVFAVACCKEPKVEQETDGKTISQRQLESAKANCSGRLMYEMSFGFNSTDPYYYGFRCIPDGVSVDLRLEK